jgi:hypothetical protein
MPGNTDHSGKAVKTTIRCHLGFVFVLYFETGSQHVLQAGLEFSILCPQPPKCWDYKCVPSHPASQRFHLISTRMATIKKEKKITSVGKEVEKLEVLHTFGRNGAATVENSMEVPQKIKNRINI